MRAAADCVDRGLEIFPLDERLLTSRAVNLIEAQRFDEARRVLQKLLQDTDASDLARRALLMNDIAYAGAFMNSTELLEQADEYSDYALKILPWSAAAKGTRGTVLVQA
jgi:tetratricopeptide (TPR) repeat protein